MYPFVEIMGFEPIRGDQPVPIFTVLPNLMSFELDCCYPQIIYYKCAITPKNPHLSTCYFFLYYYHKVFKYGSAIHSLDDGRFQSNILIIYCSPGGIRTHSPLVKSQVLCAIRATREYIRLTNVGREGFEPPYSEEIGFTVQRL
jgi:hypothetical protein